MFSDLPRSLFATSAAILGSFGRRIGQSNLFVGALVWWAALMVAATVWSLAAVIS